MNILLVEDNADLASSIGEYLEKKGHTLDYAYEGIGGLSLAVNGSYDLIILDIGLPGLNGLQLCQRLREEKRHLMPILMLTARDTLEDKLEGFRAGSDDYLVKPFSMQELELRLEALHRRSSMPQPANKLVVSDLEFDLNTLEVERAGQKVYLKPAARKLLEVLMRNTHRVVTRQELEATLWGDDPPDADALRVHIHSMRVAVDGAPYVPLIHTIRGSGYRLAPLS